MFFSGWTGQGRVSTGHRGLSFTYTFLMYMNTWQLSTSGCDRHVSKRTTPLIFFFYMEAMGVVMDTFRGLFGSV